MTIGLSFDGDLSRVRATGTVPGTQDTFTRTVSNGWGTSTSGTAWTVSGTATDYSTSGTVGRQSVSTTNVFRDSVLDANLADVDLTLEFRTPANPLGASQVVELAARWASASDHYAVRVDMPIALTAVVQLRKTVAGVATDLGTITVPGFTYVANVWNSVRLQVIGTAIRMKVWKTASAEPAAWLLTATDAVIAGPGDVAVRSRRTTGNTNTSPLVFEFDNLRMNGPAVLERSVDQLQWGTVRGGSDVAVVGSAWSVDDYEFASGVVNYYRVRVLGATDTGNIIPVLDSVWIKNLTRPFLNRPVTYTEWSEVRRKSRNGVFPVVGRTYPIGVTDQRLSREYVLELAGTVAVIEELDTCLSSGDPLFIHVPAGCPLPGMYAVCGDLSIDHSLPKSPYRYASLPLTEVAEPGADVVGATTTWQAVISTYATWGALIAANATWGHVLDGIANPADVIVP